MKSLAPAGISEAALLGPVSDFFFDGKNVGRVASVAGVQLVGLLFERNDHP